MFNLTYIFMFFVYIEHYNHSLTTLSILFILFWLLLHVPLVCDQNVYVCHCHCLLCFTCRKHFTIDSSVPLWDIQLDPQPPDWGPPQKRSERVKMPLINQSIINQSIINPGQDCIYMPIKSSIKTGANLIVETFFIAFHLCSICALSYTL